MEPEISLPYSQVPATCPYPEPTPSSPHNPLQLPEDPSSYYPPIYVWVSPMVSSLKFPHQNPVNTSPLPHTLNKGVKRELRVQFICVPQFESPFSW